MLKFSTIRLEGDNVVATGPCSPDGTAEIKRLNFMVSQYGVMIEGEGHAEGDHWRGEAPCGDLHEGLAYAVGVAVLVEPGYPPAVQTFTWCEQKDVERPAAE